MTESEALRMVQVFRDAWPDDDLADPHQVAQMFRAHKPETVATAIADRLEADLPMPGLVELSRVLRAYAPTATDPEPKPEPRRPKPPWAKDMPDLPPIPGDISERVAELRTQVSTVIVKRPPEPFDPELRVVPPEVREALAAGIEQGAKNRRARAHLMRSGEAKVSG